jgi:hypothetical protein
MKKYTTELELNVQEDDGYLWDFLSVSLESDSVDRALKYIETLPEVENYLRESTIGLEYLEIEFNHGCDITIKIPRYSK